MYLKIKIKQKNRKISGRKIGNVNIILLVEKVRI